MDYKKVLRLHYVNKLSSREIAASCGCSKTTVNQDIIDMMDTLGLSLSAQKFNEILNSPELGNYSAVQFVREILVPQYPETINHRFETNLRLSSLINKGALVENLKPAMAGFITIRLLSRFSPSASLNSVRM